MTEYNGTIGLKIQDEAPRYGRRLLPQTLDDIAHKTPERIYASIPISANISDGFRDVTFLEVSHGVNHFAHKLQSTYGRSSVHETLMYLGLPDLRYVFVFLGAVKCGYKVLLPSPRNPLAVNVSLTEQTQCTKILYSGEVAPLVKGLCAGKGFDSMQIDVFEDFIQPAAEFEYKDELPEAMKTPIVVLHSSGSTGLPRPVTMSHGTFASLDNDHNLPPVPGRQTQDFTMWDMGGTPGKFFHIFPPFHLAGFVVMTCGPIFGLGSPVIGPPTRLPSGGLISEIMKQQKLRGLFVPPSIAEALLNEPEGLELFKQLDFLCYAGGPLSPKTGEILRDVTTLRQFYGSTEFIQVPQLVPERENFGYLEWNPSSKVRMQPAEDDAFELVVLTDGKGESPLDYHFPGIKEYHTKDLFRPHPSKSGLWRFHGRRDDIIVLSNGEKFNPVPIESTLQGHPLVAGALVIGQNRFQAALFIEAKEGLDNSNFIEKLWPTIQSANQLVPGQGRISRENIRLATTGKPFVRAGKGTIVRKLTEKLYEDEITELYSLPDKLNGSSPILLRATFQAHDVRQFVVSVISSVFPERNIDDKVDLYSIGLDSLRTIEIVRALRSELQRYRQPSELSWLDTSILYKNPSLQQLCTVLFGLLNSTDVPETPSSTAEMTTLFNKYISSASTKVITPRKEGAPEKVEVAVIGTSGFLGSSLLNRFLSDPKVSKVYCLSRTSPPNHSKIEYLQVDYSKPHLGLSQAQLDQVSSACDLVVLNSWKVNFNQSLQSFDDNLQTLQSLIQLVESSPKSPRLVFMSSISATGQWGNTTANVPERAMTIEDASAALPMGYAQSKLVAESILGEAVKRNLPITILRIGQIAGSTAPSTKTVWPLRDWFPSTVATSKSIGMLPKLGDIEWIPIDVLVEVISELTHHDLLTTESATYNLVNPHATVWDDLLEPLKASLGSDIKVVPSAQWLQKVKEAEARQISAADMPMVKMLDSISLFLDSDRGSAVRYETGRAEAASSAFANAPPISGKLISKWVQEWAL